MGGMLLLLTIAFAGGRCSGRAIEWRGCWTIGAAAVLRIAKRMRVDLVRVVVVMLMRRPRLRERWIAFLPIVAGRVQNQRLVRAAHHQIVRLRIECAIAAKIFAAAV